MAPFKSLKRTRLRQQGLACNRRRLFERKRAIWGTASHSPWVRLSVIGIFSLIALIISLWPQSSFSWATLSGEDLRLTLALIGGTFLFALLLTPSVLERSERLCLVFGVLLIQLAANKLASQSLNSINPALHSFIPFVLPHAFCPLLLTLLAGERIGTTSAFFSAIWLPHITNEGDHGQLFAAATLVSLGAILMAGELRNRRQLLRTGILIGAIHFGVSVLFGKISFHGLADGWWWEWFLLQIGLAFGSGIVTTIGVVSLLPIFESIFRLTSPLTWLEQTDLNHPLLRRLSIEAPGTYHHSLQVGTLAEAAAEAIGADSTRCRVCAYFHDIGKLEKPEYFIENQGGINPHDNLTPHMSALVILAHVKDGVSLALKHRLNRDIIEVIKEHHGTSLVSFFYHKALQNRESAQLEVEDGTRNEEDVPRVAADSFRYPGPRPRSPESAILSLADSIESASRSLDKVSPSKLEALVTDIFISRLKDGQLDECGLTMSELNGVKQSFVNTLRTMHHHRISYPSATETDPKNKNRKAKQKQGNKQKNHGAQTRRLETTARH